MNVSDLIDPSFSYRLITTLMHFLWQGFLVALLAVLGDWLLSRASASRRYALHVAALAIMVACVAVTFSRIESPVSAPAVSVESTAMATVRETVAPGPVDVDPSPALSAATPAFVGVEPSVPDLPPASVADKMLESPIVRQERPASDDNHWRPVRQWAPQITLLYFACCGFLLARLVRGTWVAHRLRRMATIVIDDSLIVTLQRQSKALGLRVLPRIAWCAEVSIPLVIGVLKPMILLPTVAATGLTPDQLQALITHELAHIRRYDLLVNLVQRVVESLLFFHPAVWFISRRISNEREQACDELVLATGCERLRYADALVRMAELSASLRHLGTSAPANSLAASGANSSEFKRRVLKVLSVPTASHLRPSRIALLVIVALIVGVTASASRLHLHVFADTQPKSAEDSPAEHPDPTGKKDSEAATKTAHVGAGNNPALGVEGKTAERMEGWSDPVNQLQARLVLVEGGKNNGTLQVVPYLELRTADGGGLKVRCDRRHATFTLVDTSGNERRGDSLPGNGSPTDDAGTVTVPTKGSIRVWMGSTGWGTPKDAAAMLTAGSGAWALEPNDKGKVFLRMILQDETLENAQDRLSTWHGKIELNVPVTWGDSVMTYAVKLPNGVEVELAGVAMANISYPDLSKRRKADGWWRADGTRLQVPPFELFSAWVDESQKDFREFAIKLIPAGDATSITASHVTWTPSPPRGSSGVGGWDTSDGQPGFLKLQHTAGFKDEKQVAVHVFVSDQPLGPAWFIDVNGLALPQKPADAKTESLRKLIQIVGVEKFDNETIFRRKRLPAELDQRLEFNLRAIDQKDQPHSSSESRGSEVGEGRVFKLAAADIKYFEIRLRPMTQKVTFENVSLVPGQQSDVKVKGESTPEPKPEQFVAELPNGSKVEFVGLAAMEADSKTWWKPDGLRLDETPQHDRATSHVSGNEMRRVLIRVDGKLSYLDVISPGMSTLRRRDVQESGKSFVRLDGGYAFLSGQKVGRIEVGIATQPQSPVRHLNAQGRQIIRGSGVNSDSGLEGWLVADNLNVDDIQIERVESPPLWISKSNGKVLPETVEQQRENDQRRVQTQVVWSAPKRLRTFDLAMTLIDIDGESHQPSGPGGYFETDEMRRQQINRGTIVFNVPISRVARFEYRTRLYQHWVTFENVSLQPGQQTDVKVIVESIAQENINDKNEKEDQAAVDRNAAPKPRGKQEAAGMNPALRITGRVVDAETGKVIDKIRMVPTSVTSDDTKNITWQSQYLKDFTDGRFLYETERPWDKTRLRIEAAGYRPAITRVVNKGEVVELEIKLERQILAGVVRLPNGQPAAKAQVALASWTNEVNLHGGKLSYGHHGEKLGKLVETDEQGRFVMSAEIDPSVLVVAHAEGYAERANAETTLARTKPVGSAEADDKPAEDTAVIELQPWGRVEGRVLMGDKPVVGAKYSVYQSRADDVHVQAGQSIETDAEGRFVVEQLPPGKYGTCQRYASSKDGKTNMAIDGLIVRFDIPSGGTTTLALGSPGRTLIGKLALPAGFPHKVDWANAKLIVSLQAQHSHRWGVNGGDFEAWSKFLQTDEGKLYGRANVAIAADGSFRIEGLPPAEYELNAIAETVVGDANPAEEFVSGKKRFSVPGDATPDKVRTIDLGTTDLKPLVTRAGRGSTDPDLDPTAGLPKSDDETNPTNNANGDPRSKPAAGSAATSTLNIKYEMPGAEAETRIHVERIDPKFWEKHGRSEEFGSEGSNGIRFSRLRNGQSLTIGNLRAGKYRVSRYRLADIVREGTTIKAQTRDLLDWQIIELAKGDTQSINLSRPAGHSISGRVVVPADWKVNTLVVHVYNENVASSGALSHSDVRNCDLLNADSAGKFKTEPLPAGRYKVVVEGYANHRLPLSGRIAPSWEGSAPVTVSESQEPAAIEVTLNESRTGRGAPNSALDPTAGLPNSDDTVKSTNADKEDLPSNRAAGPRTAQDATDTGDSRILITYDIPGAEAETKVFVERAARGMEAVSTESPLKNGKTLERKGLAAGDYNVARSRTFEIARGESGTVRSGAFLDYQRIKLEPGETKSIEFKRSGAKPATGQVRGWKELGVEVLVAFVCSKAPHDPRDFNGREVTIFDALNCAADGSFTTEPLAPGDYIAVVQGFEPLPRQAQDRTGDILPRFVGTAKLTIPATGDPKLVEVTLHEAKQPEKTTAVKVKAESLPVVGDFSKVDDPDVLLDQLAKSQLPSLVPMTGGGFFHQPGTPPQAMFVPIWDDQYARDDKLDPRIRRLIELGDRAVPRVHQRLNGLAASDVLATHLTLVLRSVGGTESVPVLIKLLKTSPTAAIDGTQQLADAQKSYQASVTEIAVTSALWKLTGRKHLFTPDQWEKWWLSVKPDFVVLRDRQRPEFASRVTLERVTALANDLATNEVAARERMISLGPAALPHLLRALSVAESLRDPVAASRRLAWVIDELGATDKLPAKLRRDYFTQRFEEEGVHVAVFPVHQQAACRALSHCSFADFCHICLEADGSQPDQYGLRLRGWMHLNMRIFSRRFNNKPVFVAGDPSLLEFWNDITPAADPAAEIAGAVPVIVAALSDKEPRVRHCAAKLADIVGFCSHEKPEPLIVALRDHWLSESDANIRLDIGIAMTRFSTPLVAEAISKGLRSDRLEIVSDAVGLMCDVSVVLNDTTKPDFDLLVKFTHHENDKLRNRAVRSLRGKAPSLLAPEFERLITDKVEDIRQECAYALRDRPDPKFADILFKLADDPSEQVRIEALSSIANLDHPASMKRLLPHLRDKKVHGYAVSALASMGGKDALPLMMSELEAGNDVGGMVYQHLRRLTGEKFEEKPEPWLAWWKQQKPAPKPNKESAAISPRDNAPLVCAA